MSNYALLPVRECLTGVLDVYNGTIFALDDPYVSNLPILTADFVSIGKSNYRMCRLVGTNSDNLEIAAFCAASHAITKGVHLDFDYFLAGYFGNLFLIRINILKHSVYEKEQIG